MSLLAPAVRRSARLPVAILDPREVVDGREGVVDLIRRAYGRVTVDLTLDDGAAAETCLEPHEADWLELRPGDIVRVRLLGGTSPCEAPPPALSA